MNVVNKVDDRPFDVNGYNLFAVGLNYILQNLAYCD